MLDWIPSLGALHRKGATTFRVWAPGHERVDLVVNDGPPRALARDSDGYWSATFHDVAVGDLYGYRVDGGTPMPDPASRRQPCGVHGLSQVVDASTFHWSDDRWQQPAADQLVFYELHVGTFTPQGTFRAIIDRLPHLVDLCVTAIELMPVADFAGDRNWGYDGAAMFAPARCYGTPDDLRALVDAAHRHGLAVVLDVVYNHFGPDGAYAIAFSDQFLTADHASPWGRGINMDGPCSEHVRRFFIENALHWVHEYHVDGLRLDATHAIRDSRAPRFLAELTSAVRARTPRPVIFVAEDHRNLAEMLRPVSAGGWGMDAVWADDLHHELRVHVAGDRESYYRDFSGTTADIATTIQQGWFFTGQTSQHLGHARGTEPCGLAPHQFVVCIQNHDQVGNRPDGARLNRDVDPAVFRAVSTLILLTPHTPLLFMGQEWAADTPFLFFTDHHQELGDQIRRGRREEFRAFAAFADAATRAGIPDPQDVETFSASRLEWNELRDPRHVNMLRLYQRALALRRMSPALRGSARQQYKARAIDDDTIALGLGEGAISDVLLVVARLTTAGTVHVPVAGTGDIEFSTEDSDVADDGQPIELEFDSNRGQLTLVFSRAGAIVLRGPRLAL